MFTIPWDVKEPTHYSKRVGHEVPGVVAGLCESIAGPHQLIAARKTQPAQSNKKKEKERKKEKEKAILRTGFDFNAFFSGVLQFQLVRSLTRRWT